MPGKGKPYTRQNINLYRKICDLVLKLVSNHMIMRRYKVNKGQIDCAILWGKKTGYLPADFNRQVLRKKRNLRLFKRDLTRMGKERAIEKWLNRVNKNTINTYLRELKPKPKPKKKLTPKSIWDMPNHNQIRSQKNIKP